MRRIKQISVSNLFGLFNHTIPLNLEERITIIHGPNGFGKTILLTLLSDLFSERNSVLRTMPFNVLRIEFDDDASFWVTKSNVNGTKLKEGESSQSKITLHANIGCHPNFCVTKCSETFYTVELYKSSALTIRSTSDFTKIAIANCGMWIKVLTLTPAPPAQHSHPTTFPAPPHLAYMNLIQWPASP
jgi:hypothetical protein